MCSARESSTTNPSLPSPTAPERHHPPREGLPCHRTTRGSRLSLAIAGGIFCTAAVALFGAGTAQAKAERTANWKYESVWPAAVRFLRIDEGHEIVEKDSEAGYIIFVVKDDGKEFEGALELVRIVENRRPSVRLALRIEDRPDYMSEGLLRRLLYKLQEELGPPPPPPPPPPPAANKDKEKKHD